MDSGFQDSRPRALSVSELNHQARHLLEASFMQVWVEGELSGFSRPSSGHWYFSLKDRKCQIRCAMFRGFNQRVKEIPKEGEQVRIRGKVTLYENRGDFQIIVEHVEPAGLGALQQAYEELKRKLQMEGLFDAARKKTLPSTPRHIGVVTSPTGAAIHDILTVLARRCPAIPVTLYPTAVQGQAATADIVRAIDRAARHGLADVLIIGRGGGSLEDLWCFNEEAVARYSSMPPANGQCGWPRSGRNHCRLCRRPAGTHTVRRCGKNITRSAGLAATAQGTGTSTRRRRQPSPQTHGDSAGASFRQAQGSPA